RAIKTPVSVIYHSIGQVNHQLKEGRYFFSDIKKEGITLYDTGKLELARIRKPSPQKRQLRCFCRMPVAPSRSGKHRINLANSYN
ncbi:MAG: hypothetical protein ACYS1A_02800, partial [Planctomycetota bacterium]